MTSNWCKVKRDNEHSIFRAQIVSLEFHQFQLQNPKQTSESTAISRRSTNNKSGQTQRMDINESTCKKEILKVQKYKEVDKHRKGGGCPVCPDCPVCPAVLPSKSPMLETKLYDENCRNSTCLVKIGTCRSSGKKRHPFCLAEWCARHSRPNSVNGDQDWISDNRSFW